MQKNTLSCIYAWTKASQSEIHPSHKSPICTLGISPLQGAKSRRRATEAYQQECTMWEETYGEKATPKAETMHEKLQQYKEKVDRHNANQPYRSRDKGAR